LIRRGLPYGERGAFFDQAGLRYLFCNVRVGHLTLWLDGFRRLMSSAAWRMACARGSDLTTIAPEVSYF
jgi:hypothetical protein